MEGLLATCRKDNGSRSNRNSHLVVNLLVCAGFLSTVVPVRGVIGIN